MDKKEVAVIGGVAAVILAIVIVGGEKPIDSQKDIPLEPSKAALDLDGSLTHVQLVRGEDGKVEYRKVAPTHKRRPPGVLDCTFPDGGLPGEMNRHVELVGAGCELVAGSVFSGENSDLGEKELVGATK